MCLNTARLGLGVVRLRKTQGRLAGALAAAARHRSRAATGLLYHHDPADVFPLSAAIQS